MPEDRLKMGSCQYINSESRRDNNEYTITWEANQLLNNLIYIDKPDMNQEEIELPQTDGSKEIISVQSDDLSTNESVDPKKQLKFQKVMSHLIRLSCRDITTTQSEIKSDIISAECNNES
jgi:hypothetical protein